MAGQREYGRKPTRRSELIPHVAVAVVGRFIEMKRVWGLELNRQGSRPLKNERINMKCAKITEGES
jgi:hypothetical protein